MFDEHFIFCVHNVNMAPSLLTASLQLIRANPSPTVVSPYSLQIDVVPIRGDICHIWMKHSHEKLGKVTDTLFCV